jgi:glycerophosphoryl diester phosphodiesterase
MTSSLLIAHRGAKKYAPENTLCALKKAHEQGATWVEFDVQLSADNHAIVIHDETVDRTTNGTGLVSELDLSALQQLEAGAWFDPSFKNERIPTLKQWLTCAASLNLSLNIELKPTGDIQQQEKLIHRVLDDLKHAWPATHTPPLVSSFNLSCLEKFKQAQSFCSIGLLLDTWDDQWEVMAQKLQCQTIHVQHEQLTRSRICAVKQAGFSVFAYTVNDLKRATMLLAAGIDRLFTDDPLLFKT